MWLFLAGLPALLGVLGWVAYLLIGSQKKLDQVMSQIIKQTGTSVRIEQMTYDLNKLSPRQIAKLIEKDQAFRSAVSDQVYSIFRGALADVRLHRLLVLLVLTVVFVVAVLAFLQLHNSAENRKTRLSEIKIMDDIPEADGSLIDLDPLRIVWNHAGEPSDVDVAIENPRDDHVTHRKKVRSTEGAVEFSPSEYKQVLTNREPNGKNVVRVVMRSEQGTFFSKEFDLLVGIRIKSFHKDGSVYVLALIDDSTENLPNYFWRGDIVYRHNGNGKIKILDDTEFRNHLDALILADYDNIDWTTFALVYHGPDERKRIRFQSAHFTETK